MLFNQLPAILRAGAPVPTRLRDGMRFDDWVWNLGHELGLPGYEVSQDEAGLTLTTPLPGWAPEHLDLRLDGRTLTLRGAKPAPTPAAEGEEARSGPSFERRFTIPFDADPSGLDAELALGILTIRVPRTPQPDSTVIPVRIR